jgi:hypothetical protein
MPRAFDRESAIDIADSAESFCASVSRAFLNLSCASLADFARRYARGLPPLRRLRVARTRREASILP